MVAHSIYSDDHGATWQLGGMAAKHTNESCIALMPTGELILNARDWSGRFLRVCTTRHHTPRLAAAHHKAPHPSTSRRTPRGTTPLD